MSLPEASEDDSMRTWMTVIAAGAMIACGTTQVHAEMTAKEMIADLEAEENALSVGSSTVALISMATGMAWINSELELNNRRAIYCPHDDWEIRIAPLFVIFRAYLKENPDDLQYPYGLVLREAFKGTFPCAQDPAAADEKP